VGILFSSTRRGGKEGGSPLISSKEREKSIGGRDKRERESEEEKGPSFFLKRMPQEEDREGHALMARRGKKADSPFSITTPRTGEKGGKYFRRGEKDFVEGRKGKDRSIFRLRRGRGEKGEKEGKGGKSTP